MPKPSVAEARESLWILVIAPSVWAAHFLLCYITAAVWCGKFAPTASLGTARTAIVVYTVLALAAIAVVGVIGYRRHALGAAELPHDDDLPEDRHRFLGFATLLLAGLSAVAVIYAALTPLFIETCQ